MENVLMVYTRAYRIVKNAPTLTLLMARGERPTMRGLIPVNGGEERTAAPAETYLRQNAPSSSLPPMLALPKTFHNDQWTNIDLDPKCLAVLSSVRRNKKRSKVGKIKWVLEEGGGNNSFRSFPPSSSSGGRVREGRGWNRGNLGCGSLVGYRGVALFLLQRSGIEQQPELRRQPDSSLNCRGLAASSWCEGLECGRPPRTARPTKAHQGLLAPRSTPAAALSDVLNMSHFLARRLVANLSGSTPAET